MSSWPMPADNLAQIGAIHSALLSYHDAQIARAQRRHYGVHEEKARKQEYVRWFREELNKVFGLNDPVE